MPRKSFKDNPALAYIGKVQVSEPPEAPEVPVPPDGDGTEAKHYRINLKLRPEYREYLENASWRSRKSITQYINDLIAADREANHI